MHARLFPFSLMLAALVLQGVVAACGSSPPGSGHAAPEDDQAGIWSYDPWKGRPDPCSGPVESAFVAALNGLRRQAGLAEAGCLDVTSCAARNHASYRDGSATEASDETPHSEQPGRPGFTGGTLSARLEHCGAGRHGFRLMEIAGGATLPAAFVETHLASVWHRELLLSPGLRYAGFAVCPSGVARCSVAVGMIFMGDDGQTVPAVWPADGGVVSGRFRAGGESPEPVPGAARRGYPVSVHFPAQIRRGAEVLPELRSFTLHSLPDLRQVSGTVIERGPDGRPRGNILFVPDQPLPSGMSWQVRFHATRDRRAWDLRWRFTTEDHSHAATGH